MYYENIKEKFQIKNLSNNSLSIQSGKIVSVNKGKLDASGGRAKPFHLTSYYGEIETIKHKHHSKIKGKENSKTAYYFEVKLKDTFQEDISIENNKKIKDWIKEYKAEYELEKVDYLPILTFSENVF